MNNTQVIRQHRILVLCTTDSMIWNFLIPHINDLIEAGHIVECACSKTGEFFEKLQDEYGFVMHRIEFERTPYSLKNVVALHKLNNLIQMLRYDTIFCHEPVGGAMGRIAGRKNKCRVIYMAHGFHFYKNAPKSSEIYYVVEKWLSRFTDVLITINQEDYKAAQTFCARKTYLVNGIGVDTLKFAYNPDPAYIRNELGLQTDDLVFLSIGELIKRKNHETVIRAISRIANPKIHYVIAGDGELKRYLSILINSLGLTNVHLLGYRRDINKLCNSADVFVLPSYQEGLSVALMEAMACGKPVIASRIRGNVDLVIDGAGGILVEPQGIEEYKIAINKLSIDSSLALSMGEYNRTKILKYDIKEVKKELRNIFESIFEGDRYDNLERN